MIIVKKITGLKKHLSAARKTGRKIGFVPTMGALHEGHLALIRACRKEGLFCVVSVFVNPAQFGPAEDYRKYPRNLEKDAKLAEKAGAGLIFAPEAAEIYPAGYHTFAEVGGLSQKLCGKYRPGHFRGVATIVLKLFNLVRPDKAYFGRKDAQQLIIIKKMVQDLNLPIEVVGIETVREPDGLAMSSRNKYLSPEERKAAPLLYQALLKIKAGVEQNEKSPEQALKESHSQIRKSCLVKLQYLQAVDLDTLEPPKNAKGEILVAIAAFLGSTRLIDNIIIRTRKNQ